MLPNSDQMSLKQASHNFEFAPHNFGYTGYTIYMCNYKTRKASLEATSGDYKYTVHPEFTQWKTNINNAKFLFQFNPLL